MIFSAEYLSPLGKIILNSDGAGLTGLHFAEQKYFDPGLEACPRHELPVFRETCRWLDIYFAGGVPDFMPELAPEGSEFRRRVWDILLTVPYGSTVTYGEIARRIAEETGRDTMSAQAVGGAVGHNPISIIIPCHRVMGADGSLTGYAGGLERKQALLQLEKII